MGSADPVSVSFLNSLSRASSLGPYDGSLASGPMMGQAGVKLPVMITVMPDSVSGSLRLGAQQPSKDSAADCPRVARRGCYSLLTNTASSRIRNRRNRNPSWKFGFRIGLFCAHAIIETSKETYKNRNSLTCLKMSVSISSRHGVRKQRFLPGPSFLS